MRFKLLLKTTALTALLLFVANIGWGQITSAQSGLWDATSTWVGGVVPSTTDNVLIADGHTVTINTTPITIANLTIGQGTGGVLMFDASATVRSFTVTGDIVIATGGVFKSQKDFTTTGDITSGSATITNVASTAGLTTGMIFNGTTGITNGTTVTAFDATTITLSAAAAATVTGTGVTLSLYSSTTNTLNTISIGGNVTNNGIFDMSLGLSSYVCNATFTKAGDQTISGTGSLTRFRGITLNKANTTDKVISSMNTTMNGPSLFLFTKGTWEQTAGILTIVGGNQTVAATGSLIFSGSGGLSQLGSSIDISGNLTVNTSGTLTIGAGNNRLATTAATATLNFTKGTVNINGRLSLVTGGSTTVINGADIFIDPQSGASGSYLGATSHPFECSSTAKLTFSSGSVTLVNPLSASGAGRTVLISSTGAVNLTGSTFIFGDGVKTNTGADGFELSSIQPLHNVILQTGGAALRNVNLNNNATINNKLTMKSGALVLGAYTLTYDTNASLEYAGTTSQTTGVECKSNMFNLTINNAAGLTLSNDLTVDGILTMANGNLALNSKVLSYGSSASLVYNGTSAQSTSGELTATVPALTINNSNNVTLTSSTSTTTLTFISGNVVLGTNNLTVGSIVGAGSSTHIVTSGTGFLKMATVSSGNATYPIGPSTTSYTPVISTNNTSTDILGVNVRNTITNATIDNEKCVKLEWLATENTSGGNNGDITFTWNATDQGLTFNPTQPVFFGAWDGSKYNLQEVTVSGLNPYTVTITAPTTYPPYPVILGNAEAFPATPPALTAKDANNSVDNNVDINYLWNNPWYDKITEVWVNGVKLTATTDYDLIGVTKAALGTIRLKPSATSNAVLQHSGTWDIAVKATNYTDATLSIAVDPGLPTVSNTTVTNAPAMNISTISSVTITAKDQFSNLVPSYIFKYDATVKNDDATNVEPYKVAGTTTTATSNDVDLTATDGSGVASFDIEVPNPVDPLDGISVQVQLSDGTTDVKSPIQYFAPSGPTIAATAALNEVTLNGATINLIVQNETFVDLTLDKANFTLNHAPAGLSISDITDITLTSAKVVLAFNGTDFDTDITNFSITVPASELTLNILRTTTDLTITAVNLATVTTNATITSNGLTSASWGGDVTADGGATVSQKGICWSTSANPTISDSKTTEGSGIGAFTSTLDGLTTTTKYYVRAYATNYDGTQYGNEYNFTTYSPAPLFTATYPKSANISATSFDVVVNTDAIGKVYFLKLASGAAAPTSAVVKSTGTAINIAAASTDYSATISGLTHSTTYDVYFVTENSDANVLMSTPVKVSIATSVPVAPEFTSGYPKSANVNQSKFDVVINTNAVGKVYFLKQASGAAAPTSAVVKSTGVAIDAAAASTDYSSTITGLTASTTYDVYFVTENTAYSILMATPIKVSVTTSAIATVTIRDIQYTTDASGDSPLLGQTVTTSGIVTAIKNGTSGTQQAYSIQSGTGEWSAVYVFSSTPAVSIGDNVTITATVKEYYKMTEMDPVLNVTVVSSGNAVPAATELSTLAVNNESYEAVLVKVKRATCNSANTSTGTFVVNDGSGDVTIFKSIYSALALTVNNKYDVTGIIYDYYSSSTSTHLYEIYPRNAADISDVTGINDNQNLNLKVFPNPFSNEIRFEGIENVKRVIITSVTGQVVKNEVVGQVNAISTSELPQGMYIVTFMNDKGEKMNLKMFKQ